MERIQPLDKHLNRFALVIATIVTILASASSSEAKIVYHYAHIVIEKGSYNLDLNGDGVADFSIWAGTHYGRFCSSYGGFGEDPSSGNGTILGPLNLGDPIGPNQVFDPAAETLAYFKNHYGQNGRCAIAFGGPWFSFNTGVDGYLGFSFQVSGQTYYGWAHLKTYQAHPFVPILLGYAYETTPGMAITAGQKK